LASLNRHAQIDRPPRGFSLCQTACELRAARAAGAFEIQKLQVPKLFTVCALPYRPTFKAILRRAALADSYVELEMKPRNGRSLPYGADRPLWYWLTHYVQLTKDRFLPTNWISNYLATLGLTASGTNRRDAELRLMRIASADIRILNWPKSEFRPRDLAKSFWYSTDRVNYQSTPNNWNLVTFSRKSC